VPQHLPERQNSFLDEEIASERVEVRRLLLRWAAGFVILFGAVFLAFWWSGSAVRFSAARLTGSNPPTYRVWGDVRDARSGQLIPWAALEDDPAGDPPLFRAQADRNGAYSLLTLAEPHRIRVSAVGYLPTVLRVGKPWFIWWPRGDERRDISLVPE
jgi:hypothetical protein